MCNVLDRVGCVVVRGPTRVKPGYCADQNPCSSASNSEVLDASNLTPPSATDAAIPKRGRKTDYYENSMLQSIVLKKSKEDIGGRYPRSAPVVKTEQNGCFIYVLLNHASACSVTWASTLDIGNLLIKNSSRDDWASMPT